MKYQFLLKERKAILKVNKGNSWEFKTIPFDLDCSLLGSSSSGGSTGSILGPSRLEAEGDLVVCEILLVVDGFGGFADCDGLDAFVVCSDLVGEEVVGEEVAGEEVVGEDVVRRFGGD